MSGSEYNSKNARREGCDPQLRAVLREWSTPEPRAGFEAAVWRRIRADRVTDRGRRRFVETCHEWLAQLPAWVNVTAAAAGIIVGIGVGFSAQPAHGGRLADEPLLHSQTLAGSYLTMVTGGTR